MPVRSVGYALGNGGASSLLALQGACVLLLLALTACAAATRDAAAQSVTARPGTLDGSWIGEVHSNSGPRAWLLLSLQPSRDSTPRISAVLTGSGTPLGGRAALCTAGFRFELFVSGDTKVWSGKQIDILLRPVQPSPPHLRIEIIGDWDGHALDFTQRNVSLADILSESGYEGTEPESARFVSAQLRKGTSAEFDSACRKLTPGSDAHEATRKPAWELRTTSLASACVIIASASCCIRNRSCTSLPAAALTIWMYSSCERYRSSSDGLGSPFANRSTLVLANGMKPPERPHDCPLSGPDDVTFHPVWVPSGAAAAATSRQPPCHQHQPDDERGGNVYSPV
jgi:hypothetical protein